MLEDERAGAAHDEMARAKGSVQRLVRLISDALDASISDTERCKSLVSSAAQDMTTSFSALDGLISDHRSETERAVSLLEPANGDISDTEEAYDIRNFADHANTTLERLVAIISGFARENFRTTYAIQELISQLARIFENISKVNSITDETKLLAINAAIEAARAGDAGKGFAVVSSEVKTLSNNTKNLNNLIADDIQRANQLVQQVNSAVGWIGTVDVRLDDAAAFRDEISGLLSHLEEVSTSTKSVLANLDEQSKAIEVHISDAMRALQFEDIVTQVATASTSRLQTLLTHLEGALQEDRDFSRPDELLEHLTLRLEEGLAEDEPHMPANQEDLEQGDAFLF